MNTEKIFRFFNKKNFFFFKLVLWICIGLLFLNFYLVIPSITHNTLNEYIIFFTLALVISFNTSFIYQIMIKKSKFLYIMLFICSIFLCVLLEMFLFSKSFDYSYASFEKRNINIFIFGYLAVRNFALFIFFFWIEYFNRTLHILQTKEKMQQEEIAFLTEKQEFEKKFSGKKLLLHYFFNVLEYLYVKSLSNNSDAELMEKVKFILYYFLVDAEKEEIELEKEITFYKFYLELENIRYQHNVTVNFKIIGKPEDFMIIPLLFEPLIGNAMKYTKHDGTGWVDITIDALNFPVIKFHCRNNFAPHSQIFTSSDCGLKIFEHRLELCYKNKHAFSIVQNNDLFEVTLSVQTV
jgi:sensor histidine kinase YesM